MTGAPKIQAMRVIAELEATGREAYTGALGYASPVAGLELNVAIRTLELRGDRVWLGVGGGIVADSDPARELEECFVKARPVVTAAGGRIDEPRPARPARVHALPTTALAGGADRPDPAHGVFSTMLVREARRARCRPPSRPARAEHERLYGERLPAELAGRVREAAAGHPLARLRVLAPASAALELDLRPLAAEPRPVAVTLAPAVLPGGLGAHKWRDRRLLAELERRLGALPLLVDLDGDVLEAAMANVWIVEDGALVTAPLDGRLLPGIVRERLLASALDAREERIDLGRLAAADEIFLTSSVSGVTPARLEGRRRSGGETAARLQRLLRDQAVGSAR